MNHAICSELSPELRQHCAFDFLGDFFVEDVIGRRFCYPPFSNGKVDIQVSSAPAHQFTLELPLQRFKKRLNFVRVVHSVPIDDSKLEFLGARRSLRGRKPLDAIWSFHIFSLHLLKPLLRTRHHAPFHALLQYYSKCVLEYENDIDCQ